MRSRKIVTTILFYLLLLGFLVMCLWPFFIMISGSFKTDLEMSRAPLRIFPREPTLGNYETLFATIPFLRQFLNSLLDSTLAAVYMVPQFQMYLSMKLFGTYVPLLIPSYMNAFGIFLICQIMRQVPRELYESATIDGCGEMRIYLTIALPLSAAGIGIQGVLTFMNAWNDFMTPLIYLNEEIKYTLPIGLMRLQNFYKISYGSALGGAFLSCLPVIAILTLVGQKYFVSGMMSGAVKG